MGVTRAVFHPAKKAFNLTLYDDTVVNTYLYGVLSCQYVRYHNKSESHSPESSVCLRAHINFAEFCDNWRVKTVVFFLFVLDTVQSIL